MDYHNTTIIRGVLGEISKIQEELDELKDAEQQGVKILALCELSDLISAINLYLKNKHPTIDIQDLIQMSILTERAFKDGTR